MTKASAERRSFRSMKKVQTALGVIPGALPTMPPMLNEVAELKKAIQGAHALRDALEETRAMVLNMGKCVESHEDALQLLIGERNQAIYEADRSQAVSLRLMGVVSKGPAAGFIVGTAGPKGFTMDALQQLEAQFLTEYDVIYALIGLIQTHCTKDS